jgi:antitoxin ParD1/3/4
MCEAAMTMNVNLSPQLEAMVKAKVASGRYTSASEVVREALPFRSGSEA